MWFGATVWMRLGVRPGEAEQRRKGVARLEVHDLERRVPLGAFGGIVVMVPVS